MNREPVPALARDDVVGKSLGMNRDTTTLRIRQLRAPSAGSIAAAVLACTLVACGGEASVVGTYALDKEALASSMKQEKAKLEAKLGQSPQGQLQLKMLKQSIDAMMSMSGSLTFAEDGSYSEVLRAETPMGEQTVDKSGTWTRDGAKLRVSVKAAGSAEGAKSVVEVFTIDGERVRVARDSASGGTIDYVFKRS